MKVIKLNDIEVDWKRLIGKSFAFSVYPPEVTQSNIRMGVELMAYFRKHLCYIPVFAATDTVSAVIGSDNNILPSNQPRLTAHNEWFAKAYRQYLDYIDFIVNDPSIQKIKYDFFQTRFAQNGFSERTILLRSLSVLFLKLSHLCPFVRPWNGPDIIEYETVRYNGLNVDDERFDVEREELDFLFAHYNLEKSNKYLDLDLGHKVSGKDPHLSMLFDIIGGKVKRIVHHHNNGNGSKGQSLDQQSCLLGNEDGLSLDSFHECLRYQHIINFDLINLYLKYYDSFEPEEELRRKIALIDLLSRTAYKRTPHNTAYEEIKNSGHFLPSYMVFPEYFVYNALIEGKNVFLGNEEKKYDQHNICVCFHHIEDIHSITEKTGFDCQIHHTLHKLMMTLIMHDLVEYLGKITNMNIFVQYHIHRLNEKGLDKPGEHDEILINDISRRSRMDEPFILQYERFSKRIIKHPVYLDLCQKSQDGSLFMQMMKSVEAKGRKAFFPNRHDFFLGRKGMFTEKNYEHSSGNLEDGKHLEMEMELSVANGLKEVLNQNGFVISPLNQNAFVIETGPKEIVMASGNQSNFISHFFSQDFSKCLTNLRALALEAVIDNILICLNRSYGNNPQFNQ